MGIALVWPSLGVASGVSFPEIGESGTRFCCTFDDIDGGAGVWVIVGTEFLICGTAELEDESGICC
jgi:hypothetical protein